MASRPYVSALWQRMSAEDRARIPVRLKAAIASGVQASADPPRVFFRADDIGIPSLLFSQMIDAFDQAHVPLGLAVVPAWIGPARWEALRKPAGKHPNLWCWHQHGWQHKNHQQSGKKGEFGTDRAKQDKHDDLARGRKKLEAVLGSPFTPLFTPPWNRVDGETLECLHQLGFTGISRTVGAKPEAPEGLPDIPINVDLHTRREATPREGWDGFLAELERALATGHCGIMLHHHRMNPAAVNFLHTLLAALRTQKGVMLVSMRDMVV